MKIAMIYCCMRGADSVSLEDLEAGIAISLFSARCLVRVLEDLTESEQSGIDKKILRVLKEHGAHSLRELKKRVYIASAEMLVRSVNALLATGTVVYVQYGKTQRLMLAE